MTADEIVVLIEEFTIPLIAYLLYTMIVSLKKDIRTYRDGDGTRSAVIVGWFTVVLESLCLLWNIFIWVAHLI